MERPALYFVDVGGCRRAARTVRGREELSRPFRFVAHLPLADGEQPDPDALVRSAARLVIARDELELRRVDAVVTDAKVALSAERGAELVVVLEPRLALLRYRRDIRVFRNRSAVDIVEEVLAALGIELRRRLAVSYAMRAYCVQMRETDLDFVRRLLEDEGVSFFFDGERVVLADHPGAHQPIDGECLPFRATSLLDGNEEAIVTLAARAEMTAGSVSMRDFNPDKPELCMDVHASVAGSAGPEHYDYPGEYLDPSDGAHKATRLAEAFAAAASGSSGTSSCARLAPGVTFVLTDAPAGAPDEGHLVTAVEHDFDSARGGFLCAFESAPAARPWRPLRTTPEPTLPNPLTAIVTGPPGADVHTNALGRVKIHFPWDRIQPRDDSASDWVPVLQDNTGGSVGLVRVGWEVLVHFLEGDPDRPVVLGRLYNGADPFPEPLPAGKTRSALRSVSSPGRDGINALRFDDAAGCEQVLLLAEKDHEVIVGHDKREDIVAAEQLVVGGVETTSVGGNDTEAVGADRSQAVGGTQAVLVAGSRTHEVGGASTASVQANHELTVGSTHTRNIGTQDVTAAASLSEQVGAAIVEASAADNAQSSGMTATLTVGGALVEAAMKTKGEDTKLARAEIVGGVLVSKSGKETTIQAKARSTTAGGLYRVSAARTASFDAGTVMQISAAMARFEHAASITLQVGESSVTMKEGVLSIQAAKKIIIKAENENLQSAARSAQN